jgi:ABC-type transport system involved in cytochrome c biogenesis permease subunit
MSIEMKWPALAMLFGFMLYFGAVLFVRLRAEVIRRERNATWLKQELAR